MSPASRTVNAAYIRSALEVKAQRDEALKALQMMFDAFDTDRPLESNRVAVAWKAARAIIKKAKKWA